MEDIDIEVYYPDAKEVGNMVRRYGPNLFYRDVQLRLLCCHVRKAQPLCQALATLDAWITGLRREQSPTRTSIRAIELDNEHGGLVKVNPLVNWTEQQVWDYIRTHAVPHHPLYQQGYTSIGCAPCTRPTTAGEDPRAGRWWWETGIPRSAVCTAQAKVTAWVPTHKIDDWTPTYPSRGGRVDCRKPWVLAHPS